MKLIFSSSSLSNCFIAKTQVLTFHNLSPTYHELLEQWLLLVAIPFQMHIETAFFISWMTEPNDFFDQQKPQGPSSVCTAKAVLLLAPVLFFPVKQGKKPKQKTKPHTNQNEQKNPTLPVSQLHCYIDLRISTASCLFGTRGFETRSANSALHLCCTSTNLNKYPVKQINLSSGTRSEFSLIFRVRLELSLNVSMPGSAADLVFGLRPAQPGQPVQSSSCDLWFAAFPFRNYAGLEDGSRKLGSLHPIPVWDVNVDML